MKERWYLLPVSLFLALTLAACDSVTSLTPISTLTEANFYQTAEDINGAVVGIYASYQERMPDDWLLFELPADNLHNSGYAYPVPGLEALNNLAFQSQAPIIQNFWERTYRTIFATNAVLTHLDTPDDYAPGQKKQFEGEAKFMRALCYFDLVRMFGGVPNVTGLLSAEEAQATPRASEEDIYALIVSDLKDAIEALPLKGSMPTGRASKGAAVTLLGKVYVYLEEWKKALTYLNKMSDFDYALEEDFASLWALENEDNDEVIFAMRYTANTDGHSRSSVLLPYFGVEGICSRGQEAALLSWDLIKLYKDEDTRKEATVTLLWRAAGSTEDKEWFPYPSKYAVPHTFYQSGLDLPVLRYAEVILLKAEALYRLGRLEEALVELNKIRTRAFGDTAHNYELSDFSGETGFMDALMLERRLELAFEGERWFDLVRTGRMMEALAEVQTFYNPETQKATTARLNPPSYLRHFPIPQRAIDLADEGVLTQNEGY